MANRYLFLNGVGKNIKPQYVNVDGTIHRVKKSYVGKDGKAKLLYQRKEFLADLPEGSIVSINENGSSTEFYVAKHDYESDLNGRGRTLLVRKYLYSVRVFSDTNNSFSGSFLDTLLNDTYVKLLDPDIQSAIGKTKFYCLAGNGSDTVDILQRPVFLLSLTEMDKGNYNDGTALPIVDALLLGVTITGEGLAQWLRSPYIEDSYGVWAIEPPGDLAYYGYSSSNGVRPIFTLPSDIQINGDAEAGFFIGETTA